MGKKKLGLVPRLIIAIVVGILIGQFLPLGFVRVFKTFSTFFGLFLSFFIPFMIVGYVVSGIAKLTEGAGKLLAFTAIISYVSTIIAGTFSYTVAANFYPKLISGISSSINFEGAEVASYFTIPLKAPLDVTAAIVFAFMMGITISFMRTQGKGEITFKLFEEYEEIITRILAGFVIPLLPFHILGIFSEMAYSGIVFTVIGVFIKIYLCIFAMHYIYMIIMFSIAGSLAKKNPFILIKNQIPAYFTAVGTQSSAATIPVNVQSGLKNGTTPEIVDFVVPLCATIHLSGSMITLTSCIMGVLMLNGMDYSFSLIFPFLCMLGIAMVAAPGAPGGAVMSALPFLFLIGVDSQGPIGSLLIALYITQDSFGTAINVSGDNAIAIYVDEFYKRFIKKTT